MNACRGCKRFPSHLAGRQILFIGARLDRGGGDDESTYGGDEGNETCIPRCKQMI